MRAFRSQPEGADPGRVALQEAPKLAGKLMPRVVALVDRAAVARLTRYRGLRSGLRMLEARPSPTSMPRAPRIISLDHASRQCMVASAPEALRGVCPVAEV